MSAFVVSRGAMAGLRDSMRASPNPQRSTVSMMAGKGERRQKKSKMSPGLVKALEKYEPVVGVEVHVQLSTRTKAYCACSTKASRTPNANICPVCMGHPGTLPAVNAKVVELAGKAGLALNCTIASHSKFDRKNYFYPDTPKNYQISQYDMPIAEHGFITLGSSGKRIGVTRLHMEEDSGKLVHEGSLSGKLADSTHSLVDYNRAGVPLAEIVSEPDIRSGQEAAEYGQELQRILRYIGASDCNMQDGSLRCDVNVSIREKGAEQFGTKIELKNLNSFASVQRSVDYEIERQAAVLEAGKSMQMETRMWDEKEATTQLMRVKEGAADYRYFPEPDIPPLQISEDSVEKWRAALPELPTEKRARYVAEYGIPERDAFVLTDEMAMALFFEETVSAGAPAKLASNWIMGDLTKILKEEKTPISHSKLTPAGLTEMIDLIEKSVISGKIAKEILPELVQSGASPAKLVEEKGLKLITDPDEINKIITAVLDMNPKELDQYREGKTKLFGFFVGQLMKESSGLVDPESSNALLRKQLDTSAE